VTGWHRHRHHAGPSPSVTTRREGWGLLSGHQWGPRPGHQWGLFHGHGHAIQCLTRTRPCMSPERVGWVATTTGLPAPSSPSATGVGAGRHGTVGEQRAGLDFPNGLFLNALSCRIPRGLAGVPQMEPHTDRVDGIQRRLPHLASLLPGLVAVAPGWGYAHGLRGRSATSGGRKRAWERGGAT
jgi:hypothetical protein